MYLYRGGLPSADTDIRLGDAVVSQHGGVVQYHQVGGPHTAKAAACGD